MCAFGVCRGFPETTLPWLPGQLLGRMRALGSGQRLAGVIGVVFWFIFLVHFFFTRPWPQPPHVM